MPWLDGSCHCGAVTFRVASHTPYPFNCCYCTICRKTAAGGGYAINIMGEAATLAVEGKRHLGVYRARVGDGESTLRRHFCKRCASALWIWDEAWPDSVYPFASAIDTELPIPPERTHLMLDSKASWVDVPRGPSDKHFSHYPEEGIADWHKRLGLWRE